MKLIYLFIVLLFVSCVSDYRGNSDSYNWEDKELKLVVQDSIKIDTIIDYVMQIHQIGSFFLVEYPNDWAIFRQQGNRLVFDSFLIRRGNAPFESLASTRFSRLNDGRLFLGECVGSEKIYVSSTDCLKEIERISLWNVNKRIGANPFYFESIQPISDDVVIGGVQGENPTKFVSYSFEKNKYMNLDYNYPTLYDALSNFEKSFAMEGILMKKNNDNKYLFSAIVGLNTFIFECDGDSIYNEKFIYFSPAAYKSSEKRGQRPKLVDVQARYNASPFVTNAYIYMSDRDVTVKDVFSNDVLEE